MSRAKLRSEKSRTGFVKRTRVAECQPEGFGYDRLEIRQLLAEIADIGQYAAREILDPFAHDAVTLQEMSARAKVVGYMPREVVVALQLPVSRNQSEDYLATVNWSTITGTSNTTVVSNMMTVSRGPNGSAALVHLKLGETGNVVATMRALDNHANVLWSSPNFVHDGADPRELIPNDPGYGSQYHHPLMSNQLAWNVSLGNPAIRIGVTDDGVSLGHVDLFQNIYVNSTEIPANGIDDDSNGYIDDVNGWDFSSNNNDPNPNGSNDHGTHVAGIAAGRTNNGIGIAGVAGQATIMPLQFYAGTGGWTAAVINATYRYAADMGAQIVTTSYNVDGWVGDPVFTAGLQYMYDAGVLHFNSAGNNNQLNPARQVFEQSLFVASTDSADVRSSFSNYGTGIDIAAPGSSIYSTILNNLYGTKSGTSMSTPNAAGAAALLWGANPSWNKYQVAARLLATADNIDAQNPAYVGWLGSGRVNTNAAMTTSLAAPRIKSFTGLPAQGSVTANFTVSSFTVAFNQVMDPATVNNLSNFVLREAGLDGLFGNGDDRIVSLAANKTYRVGTNELTFNILGGTLEPGKYQLTMVSGGLKNPFATALDGDGNGAGGDSFVRSFTLEPLTVALPVQGSLIHEQKYSANIFVALEKDNYFLNIDAGQTLTVVSKANGSLVPTIQVRNPSGTLIANITGSGTLAVTSPLAVSEGGRYQITFGGVGNSIGTYDVRILLNAAAELEELGGAANNSLATAQGIDGTAVAMGSRGADRLAVAGQLPSSTGTALYSDGFESGSLGSQWTTSSSTANGRIRVIGSSGTAAGSFAMLMDTSVDNAYNRNQADWMVNLVGLSVATLRFSHASYGDETHTLPATFTTSSNGDGVAISANGTSWYTVYSPTTTSTSGQWLTQNIDLVAAAAAAGITLNSTFRIRFQQYDNYALATDGRGYDEIAILVPAPSEDWFSFTLADGESGSIAAARTGTTGTVNLELYNSSGTLLRTGVVADNLQSFISRFQDTTTNGTRDTYFVRVTGLGADYSLVVTRQAEFDREPNNANDSTAQDIGGLLGAMGFATTTPDVYRFHTNPGVRIRFQGYLPGEGPDLFVNGLGSGVSSQLRMQLVAPGGATVASGTSNLEFTSPVAGTYYLRVFAQSGSGEYFVERLPDPLVRVESGVVDLVSDDLKSVSFSSTFVNPIVIISPPTNVFNVPMVASVTNLGPNGFQLRLGNWNTDSEVEFFETLNYIVLERGITTLPNGSRIIADSVTAVDSTFYSVTFGQSFATAPVVVATVDLQLNQFIRTPRLNGITTAGFQLQTQFAEFSGAPSDDESAVYFVAMEPGRYSFESWTIESGLTPTQVTHLPYAITYQQPFSSVPSLVASIQSYNEIDPAALRLLSSSNTGFTTYIQEEQTLDLEMNHAAERVGYIAIGQNSSFRKGGSGFSRSSSRGPGLLWGGSTNDGNGRTTGNRGDGFGMDGEVGKSGRSNSGYESGTGNSDGGKSSRLASSSAWNGNSSGKLIRSGYRVERGQPQLSDNTDRLFLHYDEVFSLFELDPLAAENI